MTGEPAGAFTPGRTPALLGTCLALWVALVGAQPPIAVPNRPGSLKVAVIGDNGTGDTGQYEVAAQMVAVHQVFPFGLVLMLGDNFYGSQKPPDLERKFARPYGPLLDAGVIFQAALGNHDREHIVDYAPLKMQGRRYYTYSRQHARFFVLDTNILDAPQLRWFDTALQEAGEPWKIVYFHHPIYGNAGRHGSAVDLRVLLEPLLVRHGVHVVFSGHDHIYERLKPQKGIHYFVAGSSGKVRKGDLTRSPTTAAGFDRDLAFMIVEIEADELFFQTISRTGATVDGGRISRLPPAAETM